MHLHAEIVVDGVSEKVAQSIQKMWYETLDIYVKLRPVTNAELREALTTGNYTLAAVPVGSPWADAEGYLKHWETGHSNNVIAYSNSAFDTLLAVIRGAENESARQGCLHDAEQLLIEDSALVPLYVPTSEWALHEDFGGVCQDIMGNFYFGAVAAADAS